MLRAPCPGRASTALRHVAGPPVYPTAVEFQRYLYKYNKTHDMMAPFVINSRSNGLKFPEGYWYQHRPTPLTAEEYNESRWVAEPANLYDNDIPIHTAAHTCSPPPSGPVTCGSPRPMCWATPEPSLRPRSIIDTLEEAQQYAAHHRPALYESAGITSADVDFENAYDGFSLFHVFWVEGFGFYGIKEGEALDFFTSQDISINGPTPISPSGGNIGSGRTRYWMWTDTIQQIQGRAGERQIKKDANIGVAAARWSAGTRSPSSAKTRSNQT